MTTPVTAPVPAPDSVERGPRLVEAAGVGAYALAAGSGIWWSGAAGPALLGAAGGGIGIGVLLNLLARARRAREQLGEENGRLAQLGRIDALTGLMNRAAFQATLDDLAEQADGMAVVLFFDLDRFKDVNDTSGHRVGDQLLVEVAARALAVLPPDAQVARLGGDEFAALIPWQFDSLPEDHGSAIVDAMARPFELGPHHVEIGASVGIAIGDPGALDGSELLRRADIAMYAAKGSSTERCRMFDESLDHADLRESSVRIEVGKAMIENMFRLHFQPLVDARSGLLESAEGLLRSQAPGLRDVSPAALIATAEASGQIHALTNWSVEAALEAVKHLKTVPVAVNISPVYFRQPEFVHTMLDKLIRARVRPEMLILELTEGVLIENLEATRHSLARLREVGIRVHLDDFGTGYSSLSYLQHFELDGLKLDKSFLRTIGDKRKANQIIRSMIDFGHSLDLKVIVEGVESEWQARLLQLLGADVLQGYEIAMPMALEELVRFRDTHSELPWLPAKGEPPVARVVT